MTPTNIKNLKSGSHIHLMGICGTAMASLAGLLKDRGFKVSGSDSNPYPPMSTQLETLGIPVMKGYSAKNLHPVPDFVIVGNVISASNEEAQELVKLQVPFTSLPKAMGEFIIEGKESIVISGTHGKTTTTSMMSWIADQVGVKPGFLIGGIPQNFSNSFRNPEGNYFIIEGDEYDTAYFDKVPKFVHYRPKHVILTSLEFDHADIYADLNAVIKAFKVLIELTPQDGTLLACVHEQHVMDLFKESKTKNKFSYGIDEGDFKVSDVQPNSEFTSFQVHFKNEDLGKFKTSMSGKYNLLNAVAVIGMAYLQKWDMNKVRQGLESFRGVKRRQEILGEFGGVLLIEDFAHHPTAVRETVDGIQKKYSPKKVFSVFEPRSATSRRRVFQKQYLDAFKICHEVLLAEAFDQSKIDEEDRFSSQELIDDLKKISVQANCFSNADAIVKYLAANAQKGDLVLIMSNGGFDGIYDKLKKALSERG